MKLRIGDTVQVLAGKDRGKRGKIERVFPQKGVVVVEKVGRAKKHLRPTRQFPQGGIIEVTRPLPAANVMVVCPHCGKLTRVAYMTMADKKLRVCKHCHKALDEEKKR